MFIKVKDRSDFKDEFDYGDEIIINTDNINYIYEQSGITNIRMVNNKTGSIQTDTPFEELYDILRNIHEKQYR